MTEIKSTPDKPLMTDQATQTHYTEFRSDKSGQVHSVFGRNHISPYLMNKWLYGSGGVVDAELKLLEGFDEPTHDLVYLNQEAAEYVKDTVGPVSEGELYLYPESFDDNSTAFCTTILGAIAISACQRVPLSHLWEVQSSHLVHEQAHSTAIATRKVILVSNLTRDGDGTVYRSGKNSPNFGMTKPKIVLDKGSNSVELHLKNHFFEEAFAEGVASRFRKQRYKEPYRLVPIECADQKTRSLPLMYVDTNEEYLHDGFTNSKSAFPAHAVDLLSDYTGVDIYSLLVQSRNPQLEAQAKRQIVQVIEGAQKGLYRKLRELPCPDDSEEYFQVYDDIVALTSGTSDDRSPSIDTSQQARHPAY